jgi:ABC-type bacteriocin/lantibiotic exporter with double-glycine peptidase domain
VAIKKDKILLVPVKPSRQENGYECGLSSVMTILNSLGMKQRKDSLKKKLGTSSKKGTHPEKIKGFFNDMELKFRETRGATLHDLENRLKKQKLCLVVYQAWGSQKYYDRLESGHYSVVFGIEEEYLWLADPYVKGGKTRYGKGVRKIKKTTFEGRWKDVDHKGKVYDHWMLAV